MDSGNIDENRNESGSRAAAGPPRPPGRDPCRRRKAHPAACWLGDPAGWDEQLDKGLQEEYLVLLGGPFAAAVLAKFITTRKDEQGQIQKTDAGPGGGGPSDIITDDAGETDLVDFQYFMFNLLTLALFLGTLCFNLHDGFPDLPDLLIGLTSISGATYVAKKAAERQVPTVKTVIPGKASPGDEVEVWGENLLVASLLHPPPADWLPKATIDGISANVAVTPRRRTGADRLRVTVPKLPPGEKELSDYTPNGTSAGNLKIEVIAPVRDASAGESEKQNAGAATENRPDAGGGV